MKSGLQFRHNASLCLVDPELHFDGHQLIVPKMLGFRFRKKEDTHISNFELVLSS
jgi:hypothetical protein